MKWLLKEKQHVKKRNQSLFTVTLVFLIADTHYTSKDWERYVY